MKSFISYTAKSNSCESRPFITLQICNIHGVGSLVLFTNPSLISRKGNGHYGTGRSYPAIAFVLANFAKRQSITMYSFLLFFAT